MADAYEPREDSALLASFVSRLATGKVLDMGTGSGVQAFAAAQRPQVRSVLAVDINPLAIELVESLLRQRRDGGDATVEKITIRRSDMFSAIGDERFDTIVCNPPYLPDDENDDDPALYGGAYGYEWSLRFLAQAAGRLSPGGQIIFLFSSLTNKERIDKELKKLGYVSEELVMLAIGFFEKLYVYRITRPA